MPPITKNLIIINVLMFAAQYVFQISLGINLKSLLGLHFVLASDFQIWQLVTYLFLHGDLMHLFFNMFSLWMFGRIIEGTMGEKRFLTYYFVCGIGAAFCQEAWQMGEYMLSGLADYNLVNTGEYVISREAFLNTWTTIGASGACYGVLLAFGMMFPNERIMLLIPPIPMKAKYFVFGYAVIELLASFNSSSNIAHFAHLGGMLFGWLLILWWRKQDNDGRNSGFTGWDTWQHPSQRKPGWWQRMKQRFQTSRKLKVKKGGASFKDRDADYEYNARRKAEQERVDAILDKIKRSGYESLTEEEKRELFRNSQR